MSIDSNNTPDIPDTRTTEPVSPGPPPFPESHFPRVPPTVPGQISTSRRSTWHKFVGFVAVLFGIAGAVAGVWGIVSLYFADFVALIMPGGQQAMAGVRAYKPMFIVSGIYSTAVAILLTDAGFAIINRRRRGARLIVLWAWLRIAGALFATALAYLMQQAQFQAMAQGPNAVPGVAAMSTGFSVFGALITLVWTLALPVFMLVWFHREWVRRETGEWGARRSGV